MDEAIRKADLAILAQYRADVEADLEAIERWKKQAERRIPALRAQIDDLATRLIAAETELAKFDPDERDIFDEKGWMIRRMSEGKREALRLRDSLKTDLTDARNRMIDAEKDRAGHPERAAKLTADLEEWKRREEACRCAQ